MKNTWKKLSNLGLNKYNPGLSQLSIILTNQINAFLALTMFLIFLIIRTEGFLQGDPMGIGSLRTLLISIFALLNLFAAAKQKFLLSKLSLIILLPFIFLFLPTMFGFVEEESFLYYPYILITFSVTPLLILNPEKDRVFINITIWVYFLFILFIEKILVLFSSVDFVVYQEIKRFYLFNKLAQVVVFLILNRSVYYLRKLNIGFEHTINKKNIILSEQHINLKNAFQDLKNTQDKLIQSEKMAALGTLTAGVAHELNNPLNFISGGVNVVKEIVEEKPNALNDEDLIKINENLNMIEVGLDRATKILESLLVFSYHSKSDKKDTDLNSLVEDVLSFIKPKINNNIKIVNKIDIKRNLCIYFDKFYQVIINILDNAIYAVNENLGKKLIEIGAFDEIINNKRFITIEIKNNGPAIPDEVLKKIFYPFFTTKEVGRGTGLGLSICYNIIKEHDGDITVHNKDSDVRFMVKIPEE